MACDEANFTEVWLDLVDCNLASKIQPAPVWITFLPRACHDTESDPRGGWLGLACD